MSKGKKLNLRSKMRLRYHQIRLATMDVLQKKKMQRSSHKEEDIDGDCPESDMESNVECDCSEVSEVSDTKRENRKVGILNFDKKLDSEERVKKYVEGDDGRESKSLDKINKTRKERRNNLSCSTGDNRKASRHVSFPAELPRFRFSADSICRRKPSTTRTVSSDESLNERRALLKQRNRGSSERKQRSLTTKHNKPQTQQADSKPNEDIPIPSIPQRNEDSLTEEQKFRRSLENFYKIREGLSVQELEKDRELSPGEITSSSELNGVPLTRIFPRSPSGLPKADQSFSSSQSCESCPQSAHISDDETLDDANSLSTQSDLDEESKDSSLGLPERNSEDEILGKALEPKVSSISTQSDPIAEEFSMFRKLGRLIQLLYTQHKAFFFDPNGICSLPNRNIQDPPSDENILPNPSKFQELKAKVIALGNRRRNPDRLNRPARRIEFGIKVVLNSSPVRNSRAKTMLKRLRESQKEELEDENEEKASDITSSSSSSSTSEIDSQVNYTSQRRHDFIGSSRYQNYPDFRTEINGTGEGAFTKFMNEVLIHRSSI